MCGHENEAQGAAAAEGGDGCMDEDEAGNSGMHGAGEDGDGEDGMVDDGHERVVRREMGARVEDWSERRRGKRRLETVVVALQVNAPSRKMPKGGTKVQWTAVARDMYVEQQRRYERGEGGGVT